MPGFDQRLGVVIGGLGGVAQTFGCVAVHHHLAAEHPHISVSGGGEIGVGAGLVNRTVSDGGGRSVGDELVEVASCHAVGKVSIGIFELGGEGVVVEPVEQLLAPACDDLGLRESADACR